MKKTGIFYGSTNGDTESVANKIAIQLGIGKEDVHNVGRRVRYNPRSGLRSGKKMYTMSPIQRPMPYNPTKYCY